LLIIRILLMI